MTDLDPHHTLDQFIKRLPKADHRLLILDYDGTLAPFCTDRHKADLYPGVAPLLTQIHANHIQLAFISGRPAEELRARLPIQGIEIFGSHGHEHLHPNGKLELLPLDPSATKALETLAQSLHDHSLAPILEHKHGGIAIHWRHTTQSRRQQLTSLMQEMTRQLPSSVTATAFDGGFEFRTKTYNKGTALLHLLAQQPDTLVAYLGDDLTDEDAFKALPADGLGILVRPTLRPTHASVWLTPPDELLDFLTIMATHETL